MPYLLDVNVLIALLDRNHLHHDRAVGWFVNHAQHDWLTCPTVENGTIRIMSGPRYGPTAFPPMDVAARLRLLMRESAHRFIADNVSLLEDDRLQWQELNRSGLVTDAYLLAVAVANSAFLATMDHRMTPNAVVGGSDHLHRIP